MNDLFTRLISGVVYVCLFLFAILFSDKTFIGLVSIFAFIGLFEFKKLINLKNIIPYILLPIVIFVFKEYLSEKRTLILLIVTLLCSGRLLYNLYKENKNIAKSTLDKFDLCLRYIIFPFTFLILLPFIDGQYKPTIIIGIIVLIWTNDSFAYLTGRQFGKRKLFERVSPKKTIEGFIGGLIFTIITGAVIGTYSDDLSIVNWMIIAVLVSVFGTYGDLIESKFKRQAKVKDSGTIMPGHGGILDRLDSLYFLAPFVYLYIHYFI